MQSKMDLGTIEIPITVMGEKFSMKVKISGELNVEHDEVKKPFTFGSTKFIDKETGNALNVCPENADKINNAAVDLQIKKSGVGNDDLYKKVNSNMEVSELFSWHKLKPCHWCKRITTIEKVEGNDGYKEIRCRCGSSDVCGVNISNKEIIDKWNKLNS